MNALVSRRYSLAISLAVTLLGLLTYASVNFTHNLRSAFKFIDTVEARSLDARFQFRGPRQPAAEVVIVAIDQPTIDRLGWPIDRSRYGQMLQTLTRDGAKVVGFDIDFPFPDRSGKAALLSQLGEAYRQSNGSGSDDEFLRRLRALQAQSNGDAQFAKAIEEAGNVVLGHLFFSNQADVKHMDPEQIRAYDEVLAFQAYPQVLKRRIPSRPSYPFHLEAPREVAVEPNLRLFADAAKSYGAFNFEADNDGTFRRAPLIFRYRDPTDPAGESFYPSLDVETARVALGAGPDQTKLWFNPAGPELLEVGAKQIQPDLSGRVLINFAGPARTYPYYSFSDVAARLTPKDTFRDKIVMVGATVVGVADMTPTPFARQGYPGVEIHANVLDNILHDRFLHRGFSEEITDLWVLLFCGLVMGLLFALLRPLVSSLLYGLAFAALLGFVYYNFAAQGRWLSLVLPGTTLSINYLGVVSYRLLFEEREKRKVRAAFSQYIAPGFIRQILKNPEQLRLGGEEADLTVMFSDIRGFTSLSEQLAPPQLVELLNEYLTAMTEIVFEYRGTLDKYIGDAVMAFWGRPFLDMKDHAARACQAALAMTVRLRTLNGVWQSAGRPALEIGIGIDTGNMIVGNMGSQRRFNYTVMGDHVNLASRVESLTKEYGVRIILTENTKASIGNQFVTRELDLIRVKGKHQPVAIYELLAPVSEHARYEELIRDFENALAVYKAGDWATACRAFETLASKYPSDGPTQLFLHRSRRFLDEAPAGVWDGVYTMTTK